MLSLALASVVHADSGSAPPVDNSISVVKVFILAGQSNMDGRGDPDDLSPPLSLTQQDVVIYHGKEEPHQDPNDASWVTQNAWQCLEPGNSNQRGGIQFGPELTFGRSMADYLAPDQTVTVALIKFAVGNTGLYDRWHAIDDQNERGRLLRGLVDHLVPDALAKLGAIYPSATLDLSGFLWQQGERDAVDADLSGTPCEDNDNDGIPDNPTKECYAHNLRLLIDDLRDNYGQDLAFVYGSLSSNQAMTPTAPNGIPPAKLSWIQAQQQEVADTPPPRLAMIDTSSASYPVRGDVDPQHLDSVALQNLGNAFATSIQAIWPPPPIIVSELTATTTENASFSYQIAATNSPTSYDASDLPAGLSINMGTGEISGTITATQGVYPVPISATNANGTGNATLSLTIDPPPPAPDITSALTATTTENASFNYQIVATNSPTSYNASGLPAGLSINTATGEITGTITATQGVYPVPISATNAGGTDNETLSLTIDPPPPAPDITSALTATGTENASFDYQIVATNNPTSYDASDLPAGLSVDMGTGEISGTITASPGVYPIPISATNAGGTDNETLSLTVNPPPPDITSSLTATATENTSFDYQIVATNNPTSYDASDLPAGLSVDMGTGEISGTITASPGVYPIPISATNAGGTDNETLSLTVNPPPPDITSALTATATENTSFTYQITATNSPTSFDASDLPDGLSVDTGTGEITGTITAVAGIYPIPISATNAGGTDNETLSLTVNPPPPDITSSLTATATENTSFDYQIVATNNPTSYDASDLPAGLSVDMGTGEISGTITASPGVYPIPISATNAGGTDNETLSLTVNPPPDPFGDWATSRSLPVGNDGHFDDPNGDGFPNIYHYAFDTDPLGGGTDEGKRQDDVVDIGGEDYVVLTVPVRIGATFSGDPLVSGDVDGIIYTILADVDLQDPWDMEVEEVVPALSIGLPALGDYDGTPGADWEYRTFRIADPFSTLQRIFMKTEVEATP